MRLLLQTYRSLRTWMMIGFMVFIGYFLLYALPKSDSNRNFLVHRRYFNITKKEATSRNIYKPIPTNDDVPGRRNTRSLASALNNLKKSYPDIVDPKLVKRVLLITTFNSGSTFLGSILQESEPLTYYHYEPLHSLSYDYQVQSNQLPKARLIIEKSFQCEMKQPLEFVRNTRRKVGYIYLRRNKFLMKVCPYGSTRVGRCLHLRLLEEVCRRSKLQIMKMTRLGLKDALTMHLPPGTKLVYLQRDPRAIYSSRKRRPWCSKRRCRNIPVLCRERESDIATLKNLSNHKLIVARIEDLVTNPIEESRKLFEALDLPFSSTVQAYIETRTKLRTNMTRRVEGVRDPKAVATSWKRYLTAQEIKQIQAHCPNVIRQGGYEFV